MAESENINNHSFADAPIIYSYTRAQALEDGVLIDVTETAREAGFKHPTAITTAVMSTVVQPPPIAAERGESVEGRLWDVVYVCATRTRAMPPQNSTDTEVYFEVLATGDDGERKLHKLWAKCGPGDDGAPVITVMMQGGGLAWSRSAFGRSPTC